MRKIMTTSDIQHLSMGTLQALFRKEAEATHGAEAEQAISRANMDKIRRVMAHMAHNTHAPKPPGFG